MPSEKTNQATRREWRELGFFYDRNDDEKEWLLRGSRAGLLRFAQILRDYSENPANRGISEHDHLGPYMYLEIGTWSEPTITDHWIAGTLDELRRLSTLIQEVVVPAKEGDLLRFRDAYAPNAPYELVLELCADAFDPAVADPACW